METSADATQISRRQFVLTALTAGGGFAIAVAAPNLARAAQLSAQAWDELATGSQELSPWVVINPDDTVVIRIPHSEIGNGISTTLPQIVTEELHCDWSKVRGEFASPNRNFRENTVYGNMEISGSRGVMLTHEKLQQAGASARERLIEAAARRWNVSASTCKAENSKVVHTASGRSFSYGALAADAAKITLAKEPAIKSEDQYTFIGTSPKRLDTPLKIDGTAKYGIDTRLPNMVYAAIASPPVYGGKVVSVDETPIAGKRGIVKVVKTDNVVAVIANSYWRAKQALGQLKITWDGGAGAQWSSDGVSKMYHDMLDGPLVTARSEGDAAKVVADNPGKVIEAVYEAPYLAHAPMEPHNMTVHIQKDRIDIWNGSQSPLGILKRAATLAGMSPEKVHIHAAYVGGGFGRRARQTDVNGAMAVALASGLSQPIKVVWSREEDMRSGHYRPAAVTRFRAVLDDNGMPKALQTQIAASSIFLSFGLPLKNFPDPYGKTMPDGMDWTATEVMYTSPYKIPNNHLGQVLKNTHLPVAFWRTVSASQNAFFYEGFIDELAAKAGKDPLAYRRALTDRKDFVMVMDELEKRSSWGTPLAKMAGKRRARGIAVVQRKYLVDGTVAEVSVSDDGQITVDRVICVIDYAHTVHPSITEAQVQGAVHWALTGMHFGEITLKNGEVEQGNFDTYRITRLAEAPPVEVYTVKSNYFDNEHQWGGAGELGGTTVHAAVINAIYTATGKRVRKLPLKNIDPKEFALV